MTRVVITGMGVISSNAHGLDEFESALRYGRSGIRFIQELKDLNFACQVAGIPQGMEHLTAKYFSSDELQFMNSSMIYAGIAGIDCVIDAGLSYPNKDVPEPDWDTGAIIGTGFGGMDTCGDILVPMVNEGKVRKLGSAIAEQTMISSVSAWLGGALGLGGQVSTNSSSCTTGTEAIANAYVHIKEGRAKRMLAGGAEGSSCYCWAGFDAMRVLARRYNDEPESASRPMSASACGFVPSAGAGILMLESLDSALARKARIYAEILGAHINCGGQRGGGSMTAPNPLGVQRCIREAIIQAKISPADVDLINGHLTATKADPIEIDNWHKALELPPEKFPFINSTKSLIGHALGACGSIECIASVLQLSRGFVHASLNCQDVHPDLMPYASSIPHASFDFDGKILAKASFGFGDVNSCVIFRKGVKDERDGDF